MNDLFEEYVCVSILFFSNESQNSFRIKSILDVTSSNMYSGCFSICVLSVVVIKS